MSHCHQCGEQADQNWNYCPNCNASLQQKSAVINLKDSVMSGGITINQTKKNNTSVVTISHNCGTEGNIVIAHV